MSDEQKNCESRDLLSAHLELAHKNYNHVEDGEVGSRFKSWEHCHKAFLSKRGKDLSKEDYDFLTLNLAFYLASWGMYRGSSFLLDRDYKAHRKVVEICMESQAQTRQYDLLWDYEPSEANKSLASKLLFGDGQEGSSGLVDKIRGAYGKKEDVEESSASSTDDDPDEKESKTKADEEGRPSNILISKILLGIFGCIPAFDTYFCKAFSELDKDGKTPKLKKEDFGRICDFALAHRASLCYPNDSIYYPPMKCLDLALWRMGFLEENAELIKASYKKESLNEEEKKKLDKAWAALKKMGFQNEESPESKETIESITKKLLPR